MKILKTLCKLFLGIQYISMYIVYDILYYRIFITPNIRYKGAIGGHKTEGPKH